MYRKSAYNRKYRKRKAKALRLCRRGETEREVKRMIRYIVKRSGDKVSFDARKIKSAIFKANTRIAAERMSDADLNELTEEVLTALEKLPGTPTAQEIQNVVEEKLLAADYAKTANAYINYRTEHEHLREMDDELVKIFENLTFRPSEEDDLKRENANINADTAAAQIAVALGAEKLILLTDVRGLLRNPRDEETLIHVVHTYDVPGLVAQGIISGGMIPKMECCVDAIAGGVERVHILDGRIPHSILIELLSDEGIGTMLKKED